MQTQDESNTARPVVALYTALIRPHTAQQYEAYLEPCQVVADAVAEPCQLSRVCQFVEVV
jgi:hypothetical protein